MKKILLNIIIVLLALTANAQLGQYAVVRPDGTAFIYSSWDSAYNKAANGDNLYLPGGYVIINNPINKSLNIYGAGYNQDSSLVTGHTIINPTNGLFEIASGGSDGMITGVYIQSTVGIHDTVHNYTISRCYAYAITIGSGTVLPASNINIFETAVLGFVQCIGTGSTYPTNVVMMNSVIGALGGTSILLANQTIWKDIIARNCIFFGSTYCNFGCNYFLNNIAYSYFENCIIFSSSSISIGSYNTNTFKNCLFNQNTNIIAGNTIFNCIYSQPIDSTLMQAGNTFEIHNNYHLKPNSPGVHGGTDGTDIGIYGGVLPWNEGGVPRNPHIYFKQVAPQTNSSGQLQIQFKVRTEN